MQNSKKKKRKKGGIFKDIIIWFFIVAAIAVVIFYMIDTNPSVNLTSNINRFFSAVYIGDYNKAMTYLSSDLKSTMNPVQLQSFLKQTSHIDYKMANWRSKNISDDIVDMVGYVKLPDGKQSEIEIIFRNEDGKWKILSIKDESNQVLSKNLNKKIPSLDSLKIMAVATLKELSKAIVSKNYTDFYRNIALSWRIKTSEQKLAEKFNKFYADGDTLLPAKNPFIVFDKVPHISDDGKLILEGYYPTESFPIYFDLEYSYEEPAWRISDVEIKKE